MTSHTVSLDRDSRRQTMIPRDPHYTTASTDQKLSHHCIPTACRIHALKLPTPPFFSQSKQFSNFETTTSLITKFLQNPLKLSYL